MDVLKIQADIAEVQAETMRLFEETRKTYRAQRWWMPLVAACGLMAAGGALIVIGAVLAKLLAL